MKKKPDIKSIKPFSEPIYYTRPLLPDLNEYTQLLECIWGSRQLTNNGQMARRLETELSSLLKTKYLSVFSNGTSALQIALKTLRLHGEVITTPFTFAATTHALYWNNLTPVFCDIEEDTFTIDTDKVEELITPETTAILPVHVFGNPCRVGPLQQLAKKYGLKLIYDAAHAFGVEINGKSIASFGEISMFSLHATKIYHTIEGGALSFADHDMKKRADKLRNFGIVNEELITEPGINAKLNEVQAAMGLLLTKSVRVEIEKRKHLTLLYRELLNDIPGIIVGRDQDGVVHNYPYFVIRVDREAFGIDRDELQKRLRQYNVVARKYFYPLCSNIRCYRQLPSSNPQNLPVAEKVSKQVLSLPLYGDLGSEAVEKICSIIRLCGK
jgi:dTDP-4-amino-4,6-dideoxygalactose transaminase